MRFLFHELGASILASKKDATTVDTHDTVPRLLGHFVDHAVMFGASYAGVVDHTVFLKEIVSYSPVSDDVEEEHTVSQHLKYLHI